MYIVAKVQGFLPPTHTRHWLPLYPAPWEENTLGMNCAWLPTGWMLPLCAVRGGPGGCGWFLSRPYLAIVMLVIFWKKVCYTVYCSRIYLALRITFFISASLHLRNLTLRDGKNGSDHWHLDIIDLLAFFKIKQKYWRCFVKIKQ